MKYRGLYHLNAYIYADPTWFPDMSAELRAISRTKNGPEVRFNRQQLSKKRDKRASNALK